MAYFKLKLTDFIKKFTQLKHPVLILKLIYIFDFITAVNPVLPVYAFA